MVVSELLFKRIPTLVTWGGEAELSSVDLCLALG